MFVHFSKHKELYVFVLCSLLLGALFFYKLGAEALQSYDEAWYATIARNVITIGNPLKLIFNDTVFTDHPPMGFWLMTIPMLLFGSNEFSARSVSALLGVVTIILMFKIGKRIKNKFVGINAAVILVSCLWFMVRARSANLDVVFVFWQVLTLYAVFTFEKDKRYLYGVTLSFAAMFLTKTLVGLGMLPLIGLVLLRNRKVLNFKTIFKNLVLLISLISPWYIYNALLNPSFLKHHFIDIGTRGGSGTFNTSALASSLEYLKIGVGKWNKLLFGAAVLSPFLLFILKKKSILLYLIVCLLGFGLPFLFSPKTEIWHLIPLYAPLALLAAYLVQELLEILFPKKLLPSYVLSACFLILGVYQYSQFSNLIYPVGQPFSVEKDIALHAAGYPTVYLMGPFTPQAVYYSNTHINSFHLSQDAYQSMTSLLLSDTEKEVFIINKDLKNDLERDQIPFEILYNNEAYYLVAH